MPVQEDVRQGAIPPIRVVLADDHALFRAGLKSALALQPSVEVVGESPRLADLTPLLERVPCDVLLLDLQMERNALSEIPALAQKAAVVVVTASEAPEESLAAIQAGARGVILKRFAVDDLMQAIRTVAAGGAWLPAALQADMAKALHVGTHAILTAREREIVRWVGLGLRNVEVAAKLFISEQTVKTHLVNIFPKVGVRDRVELSRYAARVGIIGVREEAS
ncbi:MAG: response regulator transcription factor [Candidatus Binatia bacterium]